MPLRRHAMIALLLISSNATMASAQSAPQNDSTEAEMGRIASQPARDIGVMKTRVPPLLERVSDAPYTMAGKSSCARIASSIHALNGVLGADFDDTEIPRGNRAGSIAKAGGSALIDSIIPFRGLVREVSGAANAERRVQLAKFAGVARRGFLRGLYRARNCRGRL